MENSTETIRRPAQTEQETICQMAEAIIARGADFMSKASVQGALNAAGYSDAEILAFAEQAALTAWYFYDDTDREWSLDWSKGAAQYA